MALPVLALYVLITGMTPAGLRAALMWTLALLAMRFGRRSDAVTSLALTAAVLTLVTPRILWDLGFQLSVAGTAGIMLLEPGIERWLRPLLFVIRESLAVTLAAQIGTAPLLVVDFGFQQVSPVSPLANGLLLPLLIPIFVFGLAAAVGGALVPSLGWLLGLLVYPFLALMIAVVQVLAWLQTALPVALLQHLGPYADPLLRALTNAVRILERRALAVIASYYALVGLAAWGPLRAAGPDRLPHVRVRPGLAALGGVVLLLATVAWQAPQPIYTLSVLDRGGGQELLLMTPGGHAMLIDGGSAPSALTAALSARLPFWRSRLDAVVLSDVDAAHVGGLRGLTAYYTVGRALDPGAVYPSATYALWRAELRDAGVAEGKLRAGARYHLDGAALDVLLPYGLNIALPSAPVALRLAVGRFSVMLLNRSALDADPSFLTSDGVRKDTVLVLPAGASDPAAYGAIIRLLRPRLVVLPSADDARDDPAADDGARRAARSIGAGVWQGHDGASLDLTTDGLRYAPGSSR